MYYKVLNANTLIEYLLHLEVGEMIDLRRSIGSLPVTDFNKPLSLPSENRWGLGDVI
ncbi:hypothetical protein [Cyclobacterium sp. SYSU L10401]|uniref:hypothetical protein n=1 Tax=Cyclobacterium sp. SYSU L10401 TaxID=2678657 RepID=UPI0013D69760|nr:hypothetical protein [Cyclobacterium sp. SYSU L10401]